jgi:plastocyanin
LRAFSILRAVTVLVIGLALGACSGGDGNTVTMEPGRRFEPELLTIEAGERVTFVSRSDDAHTVTAYQDTLPEGASYFASGGFESEDEARDDLASGLLSSRERFEVRLDVPGTYRYFCVPHEGSGMTGLIMVED